MRTRALLGSAVMAAAALVGGCSAAPALDDIGEIAPALKGCPDPSLCTWANGTGVYTEEDGWAGMGPDQLLLTHFINVGSSVQFDGRYWDSFSKTAVDLAQPGLVTGAIYNGVSGYQVVSVSETDTVPTWNLIGPAPSFVPVAVSTPNLLKLRLQLLDRVNKQAYVIAFSSGGIGPADPSDKWAYFDLNMVWSTGGSKFYQYCVDASGSDDAVVFQQEIVVDPANATLTRDPNAVTVSCTKGAMNRVRAWGYSHRENHSGWKIFPAALQMKRASYCGDAAAHTETGKHILISDSSLIHSDTVTNVEAYWGTSTSPGDAGTVRALCVDMANRRDKYKTFSGSCPGVGLLPSCDTYQPDTLPWLLDGARSLNP